MDADDASGVALLPDVSVYAADGAVCSFSTDVSVYWQLRTVYRQLEYDGKADSENNPWLQLLKILAMVIILVTPITFRQISHEIFEFKFSSVGLFVRVV